MEARRRGGEGGFDGGGRRGGRGRNGDFDGGGGRRGGHHSGRGRGEPGGEVLAYGGRGGGDNTGRGRGGQVGGGSWGSGRGEHHDRGGSGGNNGGRGRGGDSGGGSGALGGRGGGSPSAWVRPSPANVPAGGQAPSAWVRSSPANVPAGVPFPVNVPAGVPSPANVPAGRQAPSAWGRSPANVPAGGPAPAWVRPPPNNPAVGRAPAWGPSSTSPLDFGRAQAGGPPGASFSAPSQPSDTGHVRGGEPRPAESADTLAADLGHVHVGGPTTSGLASSSHHSTKLKPPEENSPISDRSPIIRPDSGGTAKSREIRLFANHFLVTFDCNRTIFHYDVCITPVKREGSSSGSEIKARISKNDSRLIARTVFAENPELFSKIRAGYDGQKSMYTAIQMQEGSYTVKLSKGDVKDAREYKCTLKLAARLDLIHLHHYLQRSTVTAIESTIQALEVVMREHPTNSMIARGRNFYSMNQVFDLGGGVCALSGFFQSLRPTAQGLVLNVDHSAMTFYKSVSVLDFLYEFAPDLMQRANTRMDERNRREMLKILKGLKVRVTHRKSTDTYTIFGFSKRSAREETFELIDQSGKFGKGKGNTSTTQAKATPGAKVTIENYFYDQYKKEISHWHLPCLSFSKKSTNYVPMEFCMLVEGQKFSMDSLPPDSLKDLRSLTNLTPVDRYNSIKQIIAAKEGPWGGNVASHFGLSGNSNLTGVQGRVLRPPELKAGPAERRVKLDPNCQWNLMNYQLYDPKPIEHWAVVGFVPQHQIRNTREVHEFAQALVGRCNEIGVRINRDPWDIHCEDINLLSDQGSLRRLLTGISTKSGNKLQLLICIIAFKHSGYKVLKLISETEVGVMTQCVLGKNARRPSSQYLANLALKINAKIGGSNVALCSVPRARCIGKDVHVMFMGADVNHPSPGDRVSPSIAAVVATMNWPAANIYEAKIRSQNNRKEKIVNLGDMCIELVHMYRKKNGKFPEKIVFFRDGVSEGQFNMVLNEELDTIKTAFSGIGYNPSITLIIAQKRHRTRLFPATPSDGMKHGNVPPGTIVDTKIVHVREFDFYLCSHYGLLGTSKPTHYHVLWDENKFSSDELQEVVYNLCYTFARCTKPVSLVPPVYYADLVAYRGRLYYEGWLEAHVASSTSSSLSQGFDHEMFPRVHCNVEHNMFFG